MILINLLPHREAARKRRKEMFQATMFASFLVGLLIAGGIYSWFQAMIEQQQQRNNFLAGEIKVLEGQIKEIATIEAEITALPGCFFWLRHNLVSRHTVIYHIYHKSSALAQLAFYPDGAAHQLYQFFSNSQPQA